MSAVCRKDDSIGFIGLGVMGGRMASRLIQQGWNVVVFDVNHEAVQRLAEAGAAVAESPRDVASRCVCLLTSLPSPAVLQEALLGSNGVIHGDQVRVVVDLSTVGPNAAQSVSGELRNAGIGFVDSPVSGSPSGIAEGKLTLMVSGVHLDINFVEPVLGTLGQRVIVVGDKPGLAQTMKLVNNFLSAAALAASSEAIVMGKKAGLDPGIMIEVLNAGSGRNSATVDKIPNDVLTGKYNHGFAIGLLYKDVRLYIDEAEGLGVQTWVGSAVRQLWLQSKLHSGATADCTRVFDLIEDWAAPN